MNADRPEVRVIGERNLAPDRGPSVWDRGDYQQPSSRSRWKDGLGGVAVAAAGAALAAVGGSMVYRAMTRGTSPRPSQVAEDRDESRGQEPGPDTVNDQSSDSFPASDAPSWTPVRSVAPRA